MFITHISYGVPPDKTFPPGKYKHSSFAVTSNRKTSLAGGHNDDIVIGVILSDLDRPSIHRQRIRIKWIVLQAIEDADDGHAFRLIFMNGLHIGQLRRTEILDEFLSRSK